MSGILLSNPFRFCCKLTSIYRYFLMPASKRGKRISVVCNARKEVSKELKLFNQNEVKPRSWIFCRGVTLGSYNRETIWSSGKQGREESEKERESMRQGDRSFRKDSRCHFLKRSHDSFHACILTPDEVIHICLERVRIVGISVRNHEACSNWHSRRKEHKAFPLKLLC